MKNNEARWWKWWNWPRKMYEDSLGWLLQGSHVQKAKRKRPIWQNWAWSESVPTTCSSGTLLSGFHGRSSGPTSCADRGLQGDMAKLIDVAPQNRWINLQRLVCVIFTTAGVLNGCLIASMNLYLKNKISLIDESSTDLKSEVSLNEIITKFDTFMILGCSIMLFSAYGQGCHTEFQSKWSLKWMILSRNWPFSLSF